MTKKSKLPDFKKRWAIADRNAKAALIKIHRNIPKANAPDLSRVMAGIFEDFAYAEDQGSPWPVWLSAAIDKYFGQRCMKLIPHLLALHADLPQQDLTDKEWENTINRMYECTRLSILDLDEPMPTDPVIDRFMEKHLGMERTQYRRKRKAMIFNEQSIRFLIVLQEEYGHWNLHVRLFPLELGAVLATQCRVDEEGACANLRYGDFRDPSYVLSTNGCDDQFEVKDASVSIQKICWFFSYAYSHINSIAEHKKIGI